MHTSKSLCGGLDSLQVLPENCGNMGNRFPSEIVLDVVLMVAKKYLLQTNLPAAVIDVILTIAVLCDTVILGEVANFTAYAFAPAILVTPLGGLSVIVSAVLAAVLLNERLSVTGKLGCGLCVLGSTVIVLNAPVERDIKSVDEITIMMATNHVFQLYALFVLSFSLLLIFHYAPRIGRTNVFVYIAVCSLVGSISVIGVKGLSVGLKLTFEGHNQLDKNAFWAFVALVVVSIVTQMNYLNKALDTFNTAIVSPIYYVLFTTATIFASGVLFSGWGQDGIETVEDLPTGPTGAPFTVEGGYGASQMITAICGFLTIVIGVFLLHLSRDSTATDTADATTVRLRSLASNADSEESGATTDDECVSVNAAASEHAELAEEGVRKVKSSSSFSRLRGMPHREKDMTTRM
eukprot:m.479711 g.479711  ORF g.479711 m.479711 type:complete len:406 (-) comp21705_c0_seq1:2525-3742(-)